MYNAYRVHDRVSGFPDGAPAMDNYMDLILVVGMGNVLRHDDGFGVEIARRLAADPELPAGVHVIEIGIGGMHLVQELMTGYAAVIVIDALDRGSAPGTLHVLDAEVPDLADWTESGRQDILADAHLTTPAKALILAKALGVLPPRVFIVGCQPAEVDAIGIGLSAVVEQVVPRTLACVAQLLHQLTATAPGPPGS